MPSEDTAASSALSVRGLGVTIDGRWLLRDVSFDLAQGEHVAVLGPNGSGKTTLLEAVAGLRPSAGGTVAAHGRTLTGLRARAAELSYMPDVVTLPEETTLGVALGLASQDALVERFGLHGLLGARATEVSRGEAKRAELCATLARGRRIALFDEPFSAFDPRQLRALLPLVREVAGRTTILASVHELRTAELFADRILLLREGRALAFGTLAALRARAGCTPDASLEEVFLQLLQQEEPQGRGLYPGEELRRDSAAGGTRRA